MEMFDKIALQIATMKHRASVKFAKENPSATLLGGWLEFGDFEIKVHVFDWSDKQEMQIPANTTQLFTIDLVKLRQNPAYILL